MSFSVLLTYDAVADLEELCDYIRLRDGERRSKRVLDKLEEAINFLSENPYRGAFVGELVALGIRDFREIILRPYRIIYRVQDKFVYVLLVTDGRRDMQTLLQRRLLSA